MIFTHIQVFVSNIYSLRYKCLYQTFGKYYKQAVLKKSDEGGELEETAVEDKVVNLKISSNLMENSV